MTRLPEYINGILRQFDDQTLQACVCLYVFSVPFQIIIIGTSHTASYFVAIVLTLIFVASFFFKTQERFIYVLAFINFSNYLFLLISELISPLFSIIIEFIFNLS